MKVNRNRTGAALSFVVVASLFLVMVGIAFAFLVALLSGSRQGTNANDAGNLNVAKCAPLITVPGGTEGLVFNSIGDNNLFSLKNINEVWGQALLVNLNEESMRRQGTNTPSSAQHAARVFNAAQAINNRLSIALGTRARKEGFFRDVSQRNRVNLLTAERPLSVTGAWRTSCMNRGTESNLRCLPSQFPPGITLAGLGNPVVEKTNPQTGNKISFWMGYRPIQAAGRFFNFVPFEYLGSPHHVSLKNFEDDTLARSPMPTWSRPIPNAFESQSNVADSNLRNHVFDSVALCNTRERELPKIDNGFMKFTLARDRAEFLYMNIPCSPSGAWLDLKREHIYSFKGIIDPTFPVSDFDVVLQYGHQYEDPSVGGHTLYMALFGMGNQLDEEPMYANLKALMLNRANQMKPGTTWPQIAALLHGVSNITPGAKYVLGTTKNDQLIVVNLADQGAVQQLKESIREKLNERADGRNIPTEQTQRDSRNRLVQVIHNFPGPVPHGMGIPKQFHTEWTHHLDVIPGTGANGDLLDVNQDDHIDCHWYPM